MAIELVGNHVVRSILTRWLLKTNEKLKKYSPGGDGIGGGSITNAKKVYVLLV